MAAAATPAPAHATTSSSSSTRAARRRPDRLACAVLRRGHRPRRPRPPGPDRALPAHHAYLVQEAPARRRGATALPAPDATGTAISRPRRPGRPVEPPLPWSTCSAMAPRPPSRAPPGARPVQHHGRTSAPRRAPTPTTTPPTLTAAAPAPAELVRWPPSAWPAQPPPPPTSATIHQIQGAAHRSPLVGQTVTSVPGIVTAVGTNGFWFQDPQPDANPATSEGLFVFTSSAPTVAVGDSVLVSGTVSEFRPGGAREQPVQHRDRQPDGHGRSQRQPAARAGRDRRRPHRAGRSRDADDPGDVESPAPFDPTVNALDFYESMEGMLVAAQRRAGGRADEHRFGETPDHPGQRPDPYGRAAAASSTRATPTRTPSA